MANKSGTRGIERLKSRLAGPAPGSSVSNAALVEARRAVFILSIGLVLGIGFAIAGGVLGALIDSGTARVGSATGSVVLIALPTVAYIVAIALLRAAGGQLDPVGGITRGRMLRARRSITYARTAVSIGLVPDGFIAIFGFLSLIGAADSNDSGALVSLLAGIGAAWLMLIPAVIAMVWISSARKIAPALISDDGAWWWDGVSWQPVRRDAGQSTQVVELLPIGETPTGNAYRPGVVSYSEPLNPLAVSSGIAGVLAWTVCPFLAGIGAVVAGHIALGQIRKLRQSGRGWAVTGLVLGYLSVAFWIVFGLVVLVSTLRPWHAAAP